MPRCAAIALLFALTVTACGSSPGGAPDLTSSAAIGRPMIDLGGLSPADCRRPSRMPAGVDEANALLPCRQLKIVQHHLSSLLREESFRAEPQEIGQDDLPDLADGDRRRQLFFGPYWSTYQGVTEEERERAFDDDLRRAFPRLMAVLVASTHPTDIDDGGDDWWWELPAIYQQERDLAARARMMRDDVNRWIQQAGIHLYRNVGTSDKIDEGISEGDMDFPLIELVSFLHQFRDRPDLLDDDSVWTLLHKSWPEQSFNWLVEAGWMKTNIPVSGQDFDEALWFGDHFATDDYSFAETENHVLMTLAHFYLINQWVTNDYRGNLVGDRAPVPPAGWTAEDWWAVDGDELVQIIRDVAARPVHSGMFEDNARPYQQSSFRALLALASFAEDETIRTEAENALHFLATTFTFQSLDGRRWTPMRRNCEYAGRLEMYVSDGLSAAIGVLSGAYKWNDSPYGLKHTYPFNYDGCLSDPDCHWRTYSFKSDVERDDTLSDRIPTDSRELEDDVVLDLFPQGHALYAAFSPYRLPRALHGFLIDKHHGFFARMMPKYDRRHYGFDTDDLVFPEYFDGDEAFDSGLYNNEKTPAFYFVTNEFANVSGGLYNPFYGYTENSYIIPNNPSGPRCTEDNKWISDYDNLSRPYVVLPQVATATDEITGAVLFYQPRGLESDYNIDAAALTLPMMRGDTEQWFKSANIATYKNFSYGYRVRDTGVSLWARLGGEFPHDIPEEWSHEPTAEFAIGSARFIIHDLREFMEARGQAGYYLITARVRKYLVEFWSTRVARGFWEVVPGSMFRSLDEVADAVRSLNGPGNFELGYGAFDKDFDYRMVTTRETLRLDQRYGSIFKNLVTTDEGDVQGLIGVQDADGNGVDLEDVFTEIMKESHTNTLPLIDVKAVKEDFNFDRARSGALVYYACARDGWICVNNREDGSYLWVDSRRGTGFSDNPYWEHGTFDGSPGQWGCSCASGGGGWTPGPPDNGIPDDCSDPRGCDGHDPVPPRDPRDPGHEVCETSSNAPCLVGRPSCGPGETCVPTDHDTGLCQCDQCISSGESCALAKPCQNPLEQCVGATAPNDVGMCACVRE
jgi:hypothetical protein